MIGTNNLKQIGISFHMYLDNYGKLPPPDWVPHPGAVAKPTKPTLSCAWRSCPTSNSKSLYNQFRLDEPWDSPNNLPLVRQMPNLYAMPGSEFAADARAGRTYYRAFVGKGAAFEPGTQFGFGAFTDGTSNTMLVAEGTTAVPWTKPDGELDWDGVNVPAVGIRKDGTTLVLMGDATVRTLSKAVSQPTLRAAITRSAGDVLGPDW